VPGVILSIRLNSWSTLFGRVAIVSIFVIFAGCSGISESKIQYAASYPSIEPDYINVTIPPNIAPMNFRIMEEGISFIAVAEQEEGSGRIKVRSNNGKIIFPQRKWRKLLEKSREQRIKVTIYAKGETASGYSAFDPFYFIVASEPVDPYLVYREIYPGYYCWSDLKITQRCVENFRERPVVVNKILDMNCINCHAFNNNRPDRFMLHVRGSKGGTYIYTDRFLSRRDIKTDQMPGGATYPSWHPSGRYIAFSSNQVRQTFYAHSSKDIEVFDLVSDIIVYDLEKNTVSMVRDSDSTRYLKTFPGWSQDGRYLYFCRALQNIEEPWRDPGKMELVKYSLVRVPFDSVTGNHGETEMVYEAASSGKSVSFPRISPDNKYIVFTLADYGTFPNWHREADLYIMNLQTGKTERMDINSDDTESWHEFSSNGRWLLFSSKRLDGRSTRTFFAYIDSTGKTGKPFVLPQKDPDRYRYMLGSFNLPEPVKGRITIGSRKFEASARQEPVKAVAKNIADSLPEWEKQKAIRINRPGERIIHE